MSAVDIAGRLSEFQSGSLARHGCLFGRPQVWKHLQASENTSPLILAARFGRDKVVDYLAGVGAHLNQLDVVRRGALGCLA
jgi:membrane carboxypeptidase/penicillin-binding protein